MSATGDVELLDSLGVASVATDQQTAAVDYHNQALTLRRELGAPVWQAVAQANLAETLYERTDLAQAAESIDDAPAVFQRRHQPLPNTPFLWPRYPRAACRRLVGFSPLVEVDDSYG